MPNLSYRSNQKELIDDLELDNDALRENLEELAIINKYLGGNQVTISGLKKLILNLDSSDLRITGLKQESNPVIPKSGESKFRLSRTNKDASTISKS